MELWWAPFWNIYQIFPLLSLPIPMRPLHYPSLNEFLSLFSLPSTKSSPPILFKMFDKPTELEIMDKKIKFFSSKHSPRIEIILFLKRISLLQKKNPAEHDAQRVPDKSEWQDLNLRPLGPEPSAHTKLSYIPKGFPSARKLYYYSSTPSVCQAFPS